VTVAYFRLVLFDDILKDFLSIFAAKKAYFCVTVSLFIKNILVYECGALRLGLGQQF
jgi:hypothetical protein